MILDDSLDAHKSVNSTCFNEKHEILYVSMYVWTSIWVTVVNVDFVETSYIRAR